MSMSDIFSLTDRVVVITGATSGIGRGIAVACAKAGAVVAAVGRDPARLAQLSAELRAAGNLPHCVERFDVTDFDGIPGLVEKIVAQCGKIGGFVHCAGIAENSPLKVSSAGLYRKAYDVNTVSAFEFVRILSAKKFADARTPSYVFVSSVSAIKGEAGLAAYSASKGALLSGCRALAAELAVKKIRVNCILPGQVIDTGIGQYQTETLDAASFGKLAAAHLLGLGKVEDIVGPVIFLLSDASGWMTGSALVVDGGYSL